MEGDAPTPVADPTGGLRVLVLEDVATLAWMTQALLSKMGCIVVGPAYRIRQALDLLNDNVIDLAVLDININDETSYGVADTLADRGVPYIFNTAYLRSQLPEKYRNALILPKPYNEQDLRAAILAAIGGGHADDRGSGDCNLS